MAFGGEGSDTSDSEEAAKGGKTKDAKEDEVTDWAKALDEL